MVRGDTSHLDPNLITEVEQVIPDVWIEMSNSLDFSDSNSDLDLDSVSGSESDPDQDSEPGDV